MGYGERAQPRGDMRLQADDGNETELLHPLRLLRHTGLSGECQRRLVAGEATFSSLLFRTTSSKCAFRPFHLVAAACSK